MQGIGLLPQGIDNWGHVDGKLLGGPGHQVAAQGLPYCLNVFWKSLALNVSKVGLLQGVGHKSTLENTPIQVWQLGRCCEKLCYSLKTLTKTRYVHMTVYRAKPF
ncbi:hypothetical protein RHMOL_Rhmol05G0155900 [Rhododendron molle]|uniref:Uncharacterized protein n=1 Tax=Rhododendron molle TaxID=49168 RepID=A0ACC0NR18_RHOML|nr:hypothetical protein RHMOL_Rhmol05G0155900 [Rhododendron molle]